MFPMYFRFRNHLRIVSKLFGSKCRTPLLLFFSLMLTRYKDNTEEATRIVYAVVNYAPYQNAFNVQDRGNT